MTPTIIHRYSIPTADALRALLDIGDCEKVDVFIVGENLVFDVITPAEAPPPETSGQKPGSAAQAQAEEKPDFPADEQSGETGPDAQDQVAPEIMEPDGDIMEPASMVESELKGGPLARRAAHAYEQIDGKYRRWLQGYDD